MPNEDTDQTLFLLPDLSSSSLLHRNPRQICTHNVTVSDPMHGSLKIRGGGKGERDQEREREFGRDPPLAKVPSLNFGFIVSGFRRSVCRLTMGRVNGFGRSCVAGYVPMDVEWNGILIWWGGQTVDWNGCIGSGCGSMRNVFDGGMHWRIDISSNG